MMAFALIMVKIVARFLLNTREVGGKGGGKNSFVLDLINLKDWG